MESMKLRWSGDVDLNDGTLQEQYAAYRNHLAFVETVGVNGEHSDAAGQLATISADISDDLTFIHSGKVYCTAPSVTDLIFYSP